MLLTLRPYQSDLVTRARESYRAGHHAPLIVLPTGGGKTAIFSSIAEGAAARGNRVNILVHRDCILRQTINLLTDIGVSFGVIAPGHSMTDDRIQVSSVYTLSRRLDRIPAPELVIIDECHHAKASTWSAILTAWRDQTRILGVTATPCRLDGHGLGVQAGGFFDNLILGPGVRELTEAGYLSPAVVYVPPTELDLSGVHVKMGDFVTGEVADRVDKPKITGSAIEHYARLCPGAPAVAFCANVTHSEHVAAEFCAAGFPAAAIDGKLPRGVIDRRLADLASGALKIITSCNLISEGFDLPHCMCAIGLRPTCSLSLHLQQWGRALRPAKGKTHAVILDHVGNVYRHGLPSDDRAWTLEGRKQGKREASAPVDIGLRQCEKCYAMFARELQRCPHCGAMAVISDREIKQVEGELVKFEEERRAAQVAKQERIERGMPIWDLERAYRDGQIDAGELLRQLKIVGEQRGYAKAAGWAAIRRNGIIAKYTREEAA